MFGHRADGVKVKGLDAETRMVPFIMKTRNDAMNLNVMEMRCEPMDAWIKEQRGKHGISFTYMDILIASAVRTYAMRQKLNRFVIGSTIYQRNGLYVSLTVKKSLSDDAPDVTNKIRFTGRENIFQVKEKLDAVIKESRSDEKNATDKVAGAFNNIPNWLMGIGVGCLKLFDKMGILPNAIINASPFHTSFFVTNLKSIHGDYIHHHLYNFGTTGMFFSIGKERLEPCVNEDTGKLEVGKVLKMGVTTEERYCDGFYFIRSMRIWKKFILNPALMEEELDIAPIESKKETKKRIKAQLKEEKQKQKANKKKKDTN